MTAPSPLLMQRAIDDGLLPPDAQWPQDESRPWPVLLLTALGAWLAVLPLLGAVGLAFGDTLLKQGPALYVLGLGLLAASVLILRQRGVALFVEQLCLPAMVLGLCCLGWALFRDSSIFIGALGMCVVSLVLAWLAPLHWLRTLLGLLLGVFLTVAAMAWSSDDKSFWDLLWLERLRWTWWLYAHVGLAVWLLVLYLLPRLPGARTGSLLTSLADGWCVQLLLTLVLLSGATFMLGGMVPGGDMGQELVGVDAMSGATAKLQNLVSVLCAAGAAVLLGRGWPALRQAPVLGLGVALLLAVLCGFVPNLGAVCLCAAALAVTRRWRLAALGCAAALWIVGSFYYQLTWSLADKALLMVAIGAALGALAWLASRSASSADAATAAPVAHAAPVTSVWWKNKQLAGIALAGVATLLVANVAIFDKENTIRNGRPVFVRLAPVDPRSLMQGDYMRLNFALPDRWSLSERPDGGHRPTVLVRPDPALPSAYTLHLPSADEPRQDGDLEVPLSAKDGNWVFVTDAWFFKEGDAERFTHARYGEFRILPNGSALLVGMADEQLQPIR
ncbi:GDYXXLXY domain-containing protein [Variovorax sp. PAMC26660]|uniref:GDYXXLXY domain-containing protein n=1 Tax=Variovorax sp. PAMC26660 TaxID=2762322 RepID=UPI00164EC8AE|nr:GDYXXLXY domain-containing protein [Variovorax sp. PAMC26660]QNK66659.1 GDYXXLXY domain-containing protein [Variovorax sp. PAMC26660]